MGMMHIRNPQSGIRNRASLPMSVHGIIVAAGQGRRLGGAQPKAWVPLVGQPMLVWTCRALAEWPNWTSWVIVYPPYTSTAAREAIACRFTPPCRTQWVAGGPERTDSVRLGIRALADQPDDAVVLIHDAARPNVSPALIQRVVATIAQGSVAVVPVVPVTDTIKSVTDTGQVEYTLDRRHLVAVQTPQAFRLGVLRTAFARAGNAGTFPDDAALVEHAGYPVDTVEGDRWNVKITYPEDLPVAAYLIRKRWQWTEAGEPE